MTANEPLIPKHGGYRKLKSFQVAELVFDITVRFCDRYIESAAVPTTKWYRRAVGLGPGICSSSTALLP